MALTVLVRSGEGKPAPRITFDAPRIVIGRSEGCEVRLPDPSVSHRHASIRQRGSDYVVLDEGSANGTFVGPVRLSPQAPRVLRSGDLIRVGRVWLQVLIEQVPPTENAPLATRELALGLVATALSAEGGPSAPTVKVEGGPSAGLELSLPEFDRVYVVGRMRGADLDVDDPDLSRRHVEIVRRGARIFVRDLGSKNGSHLGEHRLPASEEVVWPASEPLVIGGSRLVHDDPVARALSEIESSADEKIQDGETIDPPRGVPAPEGPRRVTSDASRPPASATRKPRKAEARGPEPEGWTLVDAGIVALALLVLVASFFALVWITRS